MYEIRIIADNVFIRTNPEYDLAPWYLISGSLYDQAMKAYVNKPMETFKIAVMTMDLDTTFPAGWSDGKDPDILDAEIYTLSFQPIRIDTFGFRGIQPHELMRGKTKNG